MFAQCWKWNITLTGISCENRCTSTSEHTIYIPPRKEWMKFKKHCTVKGGTLVRSFRALRKRWTSIVTIINLEITCILAHKASSEAQYEVDPCDAWNRWLRSEEECKQAVVGANRRFNHGNHSVSHLGLPARPEELRQVTNSNRWRKTGLL